MSSRTILSNTRHYRFYLILRNTVLAMFLLGVGLVFTDLNNWKYAGFYQAVTLLALALTALYDRLFQPAFLEIKRSPSGLRGLSVHTPQYDFFSMFKPGEVRPLVIQPGFFLILHEEAGLVPSLDRVRFTIRRNGNPDVTLRPIGIGWATPAERAALRSFADQVYYDQRFSGGRMNLPYGGRA